MSQSAYITKIAKFLPNDAVSNDEMEDYLGQIKGLRSKSKAIVLRNNGIKQRYYALDKEGNITHSNLDLTVAAIRELENDGLNLNEVDLITCGTATPDQILPSMSSMVHGELGIRPIDAVTASGSCNSSMWGLNYAWMSILTGQAKKAISSGTERTSAYMIAKNFEEEKKYIEQLVSNPYIAFEKEFLRWMLSDGSAAVLLEDKPNKSGNSLKIDWIEIKSFANEAEACMYSGTIKEDNGKLIPFMDLKPQEWLNQSVFTIKQDSKLLDKNITRFGAILLLEAMQKHKLDTSKIDYFLPHISSMYFKEKINQTLKDYKINIPEEAWFTNLPKVGNVGSAASFFLLEEVFNTFNLNKGQTILLFVPESARFSYTIAHLTVV